MCHPHKKRLERASTATLGEGWSGLLQHLSIPDSIVNEKGRWQVVVVAPGEGVSLHCCLAVLARRGCGAPPLAQSMIDLSTNERGEVVGDCRHARGGSRPYNCYTVLARKGRARCGTGG